jgi:hypothetical protein
VVRLYVDAMVDVLVAIRLWVGLPLKAMWTASAAAWREVSTSWSGALRNPAAYAATGRCSFAASRSRIPLE